MINVENVKVFNFRGAFRGLRNPLNSWGKSDSHYCDGRCKDCIHSFLDDSDYYPMYRCTYPIHTIDCRTPKVSEIYVIGDKDINLAQRMLRGGNDESKFMRQILVSMDITAPDYWFKEFSTYKVATVENSTSTMHRIMSKPFDYSMFSCDGMRGYKKIVEITPNKIDESCEEWKLHPIYKDYAVSNQGRIKHLSYQDTGGITRKEKILVGSVHDDGYIFVSIVLGNQKYKQIPKHRMVAETWLENVNNKPFVNHIDGNKQNNCVDNLEWCTQQENISHSIENHLQPQGIIGYRGKLSKKDRDDIIELYNTQSISHRKLADMYNVSHTTITSLLNNKYNYGEDIHNEFKEFQKTIDKLNELRDEYLVTNDKEVWKTLISVLPMNYLYKRTWTANYQVLRNMYFARKNHKLSEWVDFCKMIETLPYARELICFDTKQKG